MSAQASSSKVAFRYPLGVALALAGGAAAAYIPEFIADAFAIESIWLLFGWLASTLCIPLFLGFYYPHHSWQWGLLVLGGQLTILVAAHGNEGGAQTPIGIALYAFLLIPVVGSGLLGALLYRLYERYFTKS